MFPDPSPAAHVARAAPNTDVPSFVTRRGPSFTLPAASGRMLGAVLGVAPNNFDVIRLLAAIGVIFSHAFPLGQGAGTREPLTDFTRDQFSLGGVGVSVFLIISGLLITRSFDRRRSTAHYVWARALRIYPGLAVVLVLGAFVLGPIMTSLPLGEYLRSPDVPLYVIRNLGLYRLQNNLPGVFTANSYPGTVNGSLWTLIYEVGFYVLIAIWGARRGFLNGPMAIAVWLAAAAISRLSLRAPDVALWARLYLNFGGGVILYLYRAHIPRDWRIAVACMVPIVLAARLGHGLALAVGSFGAYLVVYLAFLGGPLVDIARRGDLSYGVYIYAFPVQQTITALLGNRVIWWKNAALAFPIVLVLAWLSWHLIEYKSLRRKDAPPRILQRLLGSVARPSSAGAPATV